MCAGEVAHLAEEARAAQLAGAVDWSPPPEYSVQHDDLAGELFVGGVYANRFVKVRSRATAL